ncbi:MAG: hydrogenase maturation protease [Terriglobales bacterium]
MNCERERIIAVVGCGNRLAGDDAAGFAVLDRLRGLSLPDIVLHERDDLGPGFLCELGGEAGIVILIDAVCSGAAPGTVHFLRLPSESISSRHIEGVSTHALGLNDEIELARMSEHCPDVFLLGIEIGNDCTREGLSPAVAQAVHEVMVQFADYRDRARESADSAARELPTNVTR